MVPGAKIAKVTLNDRSATVTFDNTITAVEAIREAVVRIGYKATIIDPKSQS